MFVCRGEKIRVRAAQLTTSIKLLTLCVSNRRSTKGFEGNVEIHFFLKE